MQLNNILCTTFRTRFTSSRRQIITDTVITGSTESVSNTQKKKKTETSSEHTWILMTGLWFVCMFVIRCASPVHTCYRLFDRWSFGFNMLVNREWIYYWAFNCDNNNCVSFKLPMKFPVEREIVVFFRNFDWFWKCAVQWIWTR